MKKLPLGIQSFSKLIEGDYIYVDKTKDIYGLFAEGGQYYFLSRPRRFGKSLLISTLSELFSGNKELFKGLWIYDKIQWEKHPVIHIDFTKINYETPEALKTSLKKWLDTIAQAYGIALDKGSAYQERFAELIEKLSVNGSVVVLVDEYDKPIIDFVENREIAEANRKILANFFVILKPADQYLKFAFLTGVSKFSRVSVFSGLNNLRDITLSKQFSTLLGYTHEELLHYFGGYLDRLADEMDMDKSSLVEKAREWYNGYSWDGKHFIYNPFSILNLFNENTFGNYWFASGTPTFLTKLVKRQSGTLPALDRLPVTDYAFDSYDVDRMEIAPLLFQTGYLTIKEIFLKNDERKYRLDYPNREVKQSFLTYLFREFTRQDVVFSTRILERIAKTVRDDDPEGLIRELTSLFASIPYQLFTGANEAFYHMVVYLVLKLSGAVIVSEAPTNLGRMDAVLETEKKVYIMEFKMGSEREAIDQIKEKNYHEKYLNTGKEIVLLGIGFHREKRNIGGYVMETL